MASPNSDNPEPQMSVDTATVYVRRMVKREKAKVGSIELAIEAISSRYRIGTSQLVHLFKGKAKTYDTAKFAKLYWAYLDHCAREIAALEHEMAVEKAVTGDDDFGDLAAEAAALAEKIASKRAALNQGREMR